jgi:hypothetical protein
MQLGIGIKFFDDVQYYNCELDHVFAYSHDGNDEIANYQALADSTNSYGYKLNGKRYPQKPEGIELGKGARVLMHSLWVGMLCGEKVNMIDFAVQWKEFLEEFDKTGKLVGRYWPYWLRNDKPPYRPLAPGWDGRRMDKKAAFLGDWQRRARFARIFLKHTRPEIAERYKIAWRQKVGFEL